MRELSRKLDIPISSLKYHLYNFEKRKIIVSKRDSKYSRYFLSHVISEEEKKIVNVFRKQTNLTIILSFILMIQCSQQELSTYLGKHPATIAFHLRKMKKASIIEQVPITNGVLVLDKVPSIMKRQQLSNEKIYILKDPWMIYTLLHKYKDNLEHKELAALVIEYVEAAISDGVPKHIQTKEDTIDSVANFFFDFIFPISFRS